MLQRLSDATNSHELENYEHVHTNSINLNHSIEPENVNYISYY
jgi:hypothetical protein